MYCDTMQLNGLNSTDFKPLKLTQIIVYFSNKTIVKTVTQNFTAHHDINEVRLG
jgi:hypothetical protein